MWPFTTADAPLPEDFQAATTPDPDSDTVKKTAAPGPSEPSVPQPVAVPDHTPTMTAADPVLPGAMPVPRSTSIVTKQLPPLDFRWLHTGLKTVNLPSAPTAAEKVFSPFSYAENEQIEAAWAAMSAEEQERVVDVWGAADGEWGKLSRDAKYRLVEKERKAVAAAESKAQGMKRQDSSSSCEEPRESSATRYKNHVLRKTQQAAYLDEMHGLSIGQDGMFEVDFDTLSLFSAFWQNLPRIPVIRGTWFMVDETRPASWQLAKELEEGYRQVKPWEQEYQDRLAEAIASGTENKLKYNLSGLFGSGVAVIFEDAIKCRLITSGLFLSRMIWGKQSETRLYRGYSAAVIAKELQDENSSKSPRSAGTKGLQEPALISPETIHDTSSDPLDVALESLAANSAAKDEEKIIEDLGDAVQAIMDRVKADWETKQLGLDGCVINGHNENRSCTDLILAIHGMGQNLALQFESLNFVYSTNQLRHVLQKQSGDPALASIVGERRCQIIPVQWRLNSAEDDHNDSDSYFTVDDITVKDSIPYIRQLTKAVLLDLPLFMSHHRQKMIEGVCAETNKMYRLWLARNPDFEKYGKVHIIGHSLGSALGAHILSNQPTTVPPVNGMSKEEVINNSKQSFLFNTENFFMCGSPMGLFMQLEQARLVPRTGRGKKPAPPEDSHPEPGAFGCLAVDSIYNVFYATDPIANAVNATVEVAIARNRPPVPIPGPAVFSPIPLLGSLPPLPAFGSLPPFPTAIPPLKDWHSFLPGYAKKAPVAEAPPQTPQMILGERRFAELNPHGSIDFVLPSTALNNYLESVTAHLNYWTDPTFAAFIVAEMFAKDPGEAKSALKELAEAAKPGAK